MLSKADGLTLHFEKPAILQRPPVQLVIARHFLRPLLLTGVLDTEPRRIQLLDQGVEDAADANQRCRAFFVQLADEPVVANRHPADIHAAGSRLSAVSLPHLQH